MHKYARRRSAHFGMWVRRRAEPEALIGRPGPGPGPRFRLAFVRARTRVVPVWLLTPGRCSDPCLIMAGWPGLPDMTLHAGRGAWTRSARDLTAVCLADASGGRPVPVPVPALPPPLSAPRLRARPTQRAGCLLAGASQ